MNGYCKTLSCYFGAAHDPSEDDWAAIYVYRDGNVHVIGHFPTEEEAEEAAGIERKRQLEDNGQFGVGA
jgi:hypothetical protein